MRKRICNQAQRRNRSLKKTIILLCYNFAAARPSNCYDNIVPFKQIAETEEEHASAHTAGGGGHKQSDESQTSCLKLESNARGKRVGGCLSRRGSGAERSGCGERAGSELKAAPQLVMQRMRRLLFAGRGLPPRRLWWRMSNNRCHCWIEGFSSDLK